MSGVDVVARLRLSGEQFSSETATRFAEMRNRAASAAESVRTSFVSSFAEVQKLASQSLTLPRTATGSLDLSGEIASLKQSALAAEEKATALRELAAAAERAAGSERTVTEAMRLEADAARLAASASEQDAGASRQRILALEALQVELNRTASATGLTSAAQEANAIAHIRGATSAGQQRQSMIQLGQQFQDFSVQVANGGSISTAFSQQIGQAAFALQGMGGKLSGVAAFLSGPWGIAATVGVVALAPLVGKVLEGNDALKKAVEGLKKQAEQSAVTARAQEVFGNTLEGVTDALRLNKDALDKLKGAGKSAAEAALDQATAEQVRLVGIQAEIKANIDLAESMLVVQRARANEPGQRGEIASLGDAGLGGVLTDLRGRFTQSVTDAKEATRQIEEARSLVAVERGQRDPSQIITDRYKGLIEAARQRAVAEHKTTAEIERQSAVLKARRDAEIKAAQDAARPAANDNHETATSAAVAAALRRALPGVQITATTNGRHVRNSDHYSGNAIDFVPAGGMGSMTKADVRALIERMGLTVRHNAAGVEQLFGPGDPGHSNHFHVAWEKGAAALGNYNAAVQAAVAAQRQLKQDTEALTAAFDPAAAAALDYAKALAEIERLGSAGQITFGKQIEYATAARERFERARAAADPLPEHPFGDDDPLSGVRDYTREQAVRHEAAAKELDRQEEMIRSAADLFGDLFTGQSQNVWSNFERYGRQALADLAQHGIADLFDPTKQHHLSAHFKGLLKGSLEEGGGYGTLGGTVFSAITGGKRNGAAELAGGVLGDVAGKALSKVISKEVGGALGKTLGGAAGPIGSILGGVLGNALGGLFKKVDRSNAVINNGAVNASASNSSLTSAASSLGGSVTSGIQKIADALGATLGSYAVSIGTFNGKFRVSTTGYTGSLDSKHASGLLDFGSDSTAAVSAAIADAIKDGALVGISQASQAILRSGQDIDKALAKALSIESIPKDLKAMLDPVGAALDALNLKWKATVAALDEGGASAEQYADAEKLYKLQLDQVKASTASASQGLKDFLLTLKIGSASPLSLRDQESAAKAALQPYLDTITAGGNVDQSKYQSAAQSFLDIERQLYGSTQAFFDQFDAIQAATAKQIETVDNAVPITAPVADPFVKATADATAKTADGVTTVAEIASQLSDQIATAVAVLQQIAGNTADSGSSGFIGGGRGFVQAA